MVMKEIGQFFYVLFIFERKIKQSLFVTSELVVRSPSYNLMFFLFPLSVLYQDNCPTNHERLVFTMQGDYFFENCLFSLSQSSPNKGGAIFTDQNNINLSLNSCTFYNCSSLDDGGAVYFRSSHGGTVDFCKVCIYQCFCAGDRCSYPFGYFFVDHLKNNSHRFISSSSKHLQTVNDYYYAIEDGYQYFENNNFTRNCFHAFVTLLTTNPTLSKVMMCNFVRNHAIFRGILHFDCGSYSIKSINVVNNTYEEEGQGVFFQSGVSNCVLTLSSFCMNNNTLFFLTDLSVLYIMDCEIEHNKLCLTNGNVSLSNCMISYGTSIMTKVFSVYSTYFCESDPMISAQPTNNNNSTNLYYLVMIICLIVLCVYFALNRTKNNQEMPLLHQPILTNQENLWNSRV